MKRWDIYWADVPFEEGGGNKERPIIICVDNGEYILAIRITSHSARDNTAFDYPLVFWEEAGLPKKSVVRVDKLYQINHHAVGNYIGRLQDADILEIRKMMVRYIARIK